MRSLARSSASSPFDELDEAIAQANSLPFAFQAAVFTRDLDTALRAARRLDASAVMVNDHTAFRVDWMPFAGLKESGLGVGGIPYTMEEMQIENSSSSAPRSFECMDEHPSRFPATTMRVYSEHDMNPDPASISSAGTSSSFAACTR